MLVKGKIDPDRPTLVRMHRVDMAADMLGHVEQRRDYVPAALRAISAHDGAGVAVFLRDPNPALALGAGMAAAWRPTRAATTRSATMGSEPRSSTTSACAR